MRDYGRVHTTFWASETLRALDDDAKMLALYLLTCSHAHMAGVFHLPTAYVAHDMGWASERLSNGFRTLSDAGWLHRCERSGWVWITKFTKFNPPDNPNQQKAIDKQIALVPENASFKAAISGTVVKPLNNTPVPAPAPVPVLKAETGDDSATILAAYHATLPACQAVAVLGPKRKRVLAAAVKQAKQVCREQGWPYDATEFWTAYFTECASDEWLRGDKPNPNNPAWRQKLDTLIDETRFTQVMDRAIAAMRGGK